MAEHQTIFVFQAAFDDLRQPETKQNAGEKTQETLHQNSLHYADIADKMKLPHDVPLADWQYQMLEAKANRDLNTFFRIAIAQQLNIAHQTHIHQQNAIAYLRATTQQYHTLFLDPPYAWNDWVNLFPVIQPRLHAHAYVYLEAGQIPPLPEWLSIHRQGKAGQSQFLLLKHVQPTD